MAKSTRYRFEFISAQTNAFSDARKDSWAGTNSTTILQDADVDIRMDGTASSSATVNFQGLTKADVVIVRSPVDLVVRLNSGSENIPVNTFAGSEAIAFFTTSATALKLIKGATSASALVNVRLQGT